MFLDMARKLHVEGYDELQSALQMNQRQIIFVLFSGSSEETGQSWCPDCVKGSLLLLISVVFVILTSFLFFFIFWMLWHYINCIIIIIIQTE